MGGSNVDTCLSADGAVWGAIATTSEGEAGCLWVPLALVQPLLEPNQKVMGQDDHGHVVVPAAPEAQLIVVETEFPVSLGKARFDGPAHPTHPHQRVQGCLARRTTQVHLQFRVRACRVNLAAKQHPDL